MSKKVSQEDFENFVKEVAHVISIMGADVMKMQTIMYNLLDEMGKVEKPSCVSCKETLLIPVVQNVDKSEVCPNCGENIFGNEQTTFESWDDGTIGGEEE